MHEIAHLLGIDTQQSDYYDFWSGIATQLSLIIGGIALYRKHNCHIHWCWRIGKFPIGNYFVCAKHHPEVPGKIKVEHLV